MKLRVVAAVAAVVAVAVAACGTANVLTPPLAVREAAASTFSQGSARITLTLVGKEGDIVALFAGAGTPTADDRRGAALVRSGRIVLSVGGGKSADDFALEVDLGDVAGAVEARMVDGALYARADLAGLLALFDVEPGMLAEAVAGAQQAGFGFVADAAAGRWLSTDLAALESFMKGFSESGAGVPQLDADHARRVLDAVAATFGEDVKVDRLERDGTGDHYRLTVPLRRVYERLLPVLGSLPGFPAAAVLPPAGEVPDESVTADVWVRDGRIVRGELDLAQFDGGPAGRVALRIDIARLDGAITAPRDAVEINVFEIAGRLMATLGEGFPIGS